jgi:hypothetical protein
MALYPLKDIYILFLVNRHGRYILVYKRVYDSSLNLLKAYKRFWIFRTYVVVLVGVGVFQTLCHSIESLID